MPNNTLIAAKEDLGFLREYDPSVFTLTDGAGFARINKESIRYYDASEPRTPVYTTDIASIFERHNYIAAENWIIDEAAVRDGKL